METIDVLMKGEPSMLCFQQYRVSTLPLYINFKIALKASSIIFTGVIFTIFLFTNGQQSEMAIQIVF